jgi:hypothetical protein
MANVNISQTLPNLQNMLNNASQLSPVNLPTITNSQNSSTSQSSQGSQDSQQLPTDLILSPAQIFNYNALMNTIPNEINDAKHDSNPHNHAAQNISNDITNVMNSYTNPSNYPGLTGILNNMAQQGEQALPNYIQSQENSANFTNNWQTPTTNPASINLATGQNLQNPILNQYNQSYQAHSQNLQNLQSQFQSNLNQVKTSIQNNLNQLKDPSTAQALIMGTTATYLQNAFNQLSPYMQGNDYQQAVQTLQTAYTNDSQFVNSYNNLFQNYLGLNINLIDSLKSLQPDAINQAVDSTVSSAAGDTEALNAIAKGMGTPQNELQAAEAKQQSMMQNAQNAVAQITGNTGANESLIQNAQNALAQLLGIPQNGLQQNNYSQNYSPSLENVVQQYQNTMNLPYSNNNINNMNYAVNEINKMTNEYNSMRSYEEEQAANAAEEQQWQPGG